MKKEQTLTLVVVMAVISSLVYTNVQNYVVLNNPDIDPFWITLIPTVTVAIVGYYLTRWLRK